ncbi:MAG: UDP-N-acetylglucosamine--N-acetylmuramyl-(pentapeptide) pyrophosphoryl-undecaprenol N-acetylglucosamine transferase [Anaerolineales bacterium]|nr:UDP-N-acetylglucosamine--N-acetylmuramyl-(pentapeptide) pyrophosphoryl-undecaprenol N-acetylglucosamine transferase [Anaerolineales bacterium]
MRLLICAGGTGGGVYPALSVLLYLKNVEARQSDEISPLAASAVETLWVGGQGGMEAELVKREGVGFETIPAAQVHGVGLRAVPGLWQVGRGFLASLGILRKFRPDVLLFTGGYVAVPMALAAWFKRRLTRSEGLRSLLYVPDIEPGWALKTLARFADQVALTVDESRPFFSHHSSLSVTGYPLRPELGAYSLAAARQFFGLSADLPVLLVFGGSKGSRAINRALLAALPELLKEMQVVHITGTLDWPEVEQTRSALGPEQSLRYRAYPYLHREMGAALRVADLAITRAGASTLGELPYFGLPAILVPYPYAWRYQRVNADYLAGHGAAVVLEDADLPAQMASMAREIMMDVSRREKMGQAMRSLATPQAAARIAAVLGNLAGIGQGVRI